MKKQRKRERERNGANKRIDERQGSLKSRVGSNLQGRLSCISLTRRGASVGSMGCTEEQLGEELRLKWNISKTPRSVCLPRRIFNHSASSYCLITVNVSGHYFGLSIKLDLSARVIFASCTWRTTLILQLQTQIRTNYPDSLDEFRLCLSIYIHSTRYTVTVTESLFEKW